ncbi:MAG: Ig-like domain-containing protein [Bacteroidota bacterium]
MKHVILYTWLVSLSWGLPMITQAQSGRIVGSMPRDGAQNLICTAFISAGYRLPDSTELDIYTLNDTSVRLYALSEPDSLLPAFVSANEAFQTITLEPHVQLDPNTTYIFEVTDSVKDASGTSFKPYRIEFKTGTTQMPKYISMNRKPLPPKPKPGPKFEAPKGYAALASARRVWLSPAEIAAAKAAQEAREAEAAKLAAEAPVPKSDPVDEKASTTDMAREADDSKAAAAEIPPPAPVMPAALAIRVLKTAIEKGQSLPYEIDAPEAIQVQYLIKAQGGTVVKRGAGAMEPGFHERALALGELDAGRYRLSFKIGEEVKHHVFSIR